MIEIIRIVCSIIPATHRKAGISVPSCVFILKGYIDNIDIDSDIITSLLLVQMCKPSLTLVRNNVTSVRSSQCWCFAVASRECYTLRLLTMVTCVDGRTHYSLHGMVQHYMQMFHVAVILRSHFLHLVTLSQTSLVTRRSS